MISRNPKAMPDFNGAQFRYQQKDKIMIRIMIRKVTLYTK